MRLCTVFPKNWGTESGRPFRLPLSETLTSSFSTTRKDGELRNSEASA